MQRVNIGFESGAALAVRVEDDVLESLRSALQGNGWHQLDTADGRVDLKLDEVVYVSEASNAPTIGFSGTSSRARAPARSSRSDRARGQGYESGPGRPTCLHTSWWPLCRLPRSGRFAHAPPPGRSGRGRARPPV